MRGGRSLLYITVVFVGGCGAGWERAPVSPARSLDPRQQVQVWSNGQSHQWHGVELTRDSISGVPYVAQVSCDSCRVALPIGTVDSLRYGDPVAGFWKSTGVFLGLALVLAVVLGYPVST